MTISKAKRERRIYAEDACLSLEQTLDEAGSTDWLECRGELAVQFTGSATAIEAQVERSTRPPSDQQGPNPAPAGASLAGNPAAGMQPVGYREPGYSWWRVRLLEAPVGGPVTVTISGKGL